MLEILKLVVMMIGVVIGILALLWRGAVGLAMYNNGGADTLSKFLAWVVCIPFLLMALWLIGWSLFI